jgi:hypothetical protein
MNKLIESQITSLWLLPVIALMLTGCMSACAKENENGVLWKGSRAYEKQVASFKVRPDKAFKLALAEMQKMDTKDERRRMAVREPEFIIDRWYWFGDATKTEIYVAGFYVNGDTGKIEYRESKKTIKSGSKKLTKDAWSRITPLSESKLSP